MDDASEGVIAAKVALRRALLERRRRLDAAALAERSRRLVQTLLGDPLWAQARGIAAFVGVAGEPDTRALLAAALAEGKALWLPRVLRGPGHLEFVAVDDLDRLGPAAFGLLEPLPAAGERTCRHPEGVDLVLVPGLAFDREGARIGFGKGYYDRALAPLRDRSPPLRVGVGFVDFVDPAEGPIPMGPSDVRVHAIATDEGLTPIAARRG
ncbi:MAG: 5-formyltetrahydrofolate cyclo-ligase [Nannocystaceae bacterium]